MNRAHGLARPIGTSEPRERARRLVVGRGRYTDDHNAGRMLVAAFVRSPYARADIVNIDTSAAVATEGVHSVFTWSDFEAICQPWEARHGMFPEMLAPLQHPLADSRVNYQGEPVAIVVAKSRALAEDGIEGVLVDYEPLDAVASIDRALVEDGPLIHEDLGTNVCFRTTSGNGTFGSAFEDADLEIEETIDFGRHTACSLETRSIIADFDPASKTLVVRISHQCPHQLQDALAHVLGLPDHHVRIIAEDVGGAYGMKQQLYADEVAVCAAAIRLGRPVKFVADRLEAFASDNHAREHRVRARLAVRKDGRILGMEVDDFFPIGAFPQYPRTSLGEGNHVLRTSAAGYDISDFRSRLTMLFQNKSLVGHYRSVGHPIACAITEHLIDVAGRRLDLAPEDMRRINYVADDGYPRTTPTGLHLHYLSQQACLDRLLTMMDIERIRREQRDALARGIHRGIGLASFVELTGTANSFYGPGGIHVSGQDGCALKLEPSGTVRCAPSVTDQGQGTDTGIAQIVASVLGLATSDVRVTSGDSETSPYGGGAWASRGISTGGEAAHKAAMALKENILSIAAHLLQSDLSRLDLSDGTIVDESGAPRMTIAEVAQIGYFRHDLIPADLQPELSVVRHSAPRKQLFQATNGIQASHVEVDISTGFVRLLDHWVVHDAGTVINPLLVDEQIRGGVVQGLGAALFEELVYDEEGQLRTASLADYLVPMAGDVPDIHVAHVESPAAEGVLGAKGVGEAGVAGASGAVLNAVNDALAPFDAIVRRLPIRPRDVLCALGKIAD